MAGRRQRLISPPEPKKVDPINSLPDAVIHHIFSFLPFKDLVKTSVLSKQWCFAWTSTPYIDLYLPSRRVFLLMDRALSHYTATKIEKFHLVATGSDLFIPDELDSWCRFAVARKVEDASLIFVSSYYLVPQILCDCASLVSLQVRRCLFSWNTIINWPSLKKLCIHGTDQLDKDKIVKILSGCPVLESLRLLFFSPGHRDLRIDSRSIRELLIHADYVSLDISAPNLLSLRLSCRSGVKRFRLNGVSSLAEAELSFNQSTVAPGLLFSQLKLLLEQLQPVVKITIGSLCVKVLSLAMEKGMPYLSSRWRTIIVHSAVCNRGLLGIAYLLQSSPLLERLVIWNLRYDTSTVENKGFPELCDFDRKQIWRSQKEVYCLANHLKRVEIMGLKFDNEKSRPLLVLAKFLIKKAIGLEKMIIDVKLWMSSRGVPSDPHDLSGFRDVTQLQKVCRRASRNAEVIVKYR